MPSANCVLFSNKEELCVYFRSICPQLPLIFQNATAVEIQCKNKEQKHIENLL